MSTLHEWWPDLPETVLDPPDATFEEGFEGAFGG